MRAPSPDASAGPTVPPSACAGGRGSRSLDECVYHSPPQLSSTGMCATEMCFWASCTAIHCSLLALPLERRGLGCVPLSTAAAASPVSRTTSENSRVPTMGPLQGGGSSTVCVATAVDVAVAGAAAAVLLLPPRWCGGACSPSRLATASLPTSPGPSRCLLARSRRGLATCPCPAAAADAWCTCGACSSASAAAAATTARTSSVRFKGACISTHTSKRSHTHKAHWRVSKMSAWALAQFG